MTDKDYHDGAETIVLAGYTFDAHKACIVCKHIMSGMPVLQFAHNSDGDLQFLCGAPDHEPEEGEVVCTHCVTEQHPDVFTLPTVDFGMGAFRSEVGAVWELDELSEEED